MLRRALPQGGARLDWVWRGLVAAGLLCLASAAPAQTNLPASPLLLTNISDIWAVTGPDAQQPQRIRAEAVIVFYDADWTVAFGLCEGKFTYLPIGTSKLPLKTGQRILLDGWVVPLREAFSWDKTKITVLEENIPLQVIPVTSLRTNIQQVNRQLVSAEGLIDQCTIVDDTHLRLAFILNGETAVVNVHLHSANQAVAFQQADFVRLTGLFIGDLDRDGNVSTVTLWVDGAENVDRIGSVAADPRFAIPAVRVDQLMTDPAYSGLVRVAGVVHGHEPGKWVTMWDETGAVMIQSAQTQPLRFGDRIEAIGYPYEIGVHHYLRPGLYRMADTNKLAPISDSSTNAILRLAAQIQSLGPEEVNRHPQVNLRAVLLWSDAATPFIYVQDSSGCVRVVNPKFIDPNQSDGTILNIAGEVAAGAYVPVVTNAVASRNGWTTPELAEPTDLYQALSGAVEGRFVEMRGYIRDASLENGLTLLHLSTSQGEFQAWVPGSEPSPTWVGSVVRIRGVCAATSNDRHQLTGIELWVPAGGNILIEEKAPDDLFASPLHSLGNLRRFNSQQFVNQRVRTAGTVVLQQPGRYLYVQDGTDCVLALSQQTDLLQPGDLVEVVGFPGIEGRRFLLREAAFRRLRHGVEPTPVPLPARHLVNPSLEGSLARSSGTLLDAFWKDGQARFLLQGAGYTFEARLESPDANGAGKLKELTLKSKLQVTGVYELQTDEYGHPASFNLHLRSWNDAVLLATPPWWTLSRLLVLLLVVVLGSVVALAWGLYISHKNTLLHRAQAELKSANAQLEDRVLLRTGELREQIKVKELALSDLAQAQQRLMLASRQAGMAEVATSVLHNVGNVLNSVNVSVSCLRDRVQHLRVESVGQTAALLHQPNGQLAGFLQEDPRGRTVPVFLAKLGENLVQDKLELKNEIESLIKSVEHVNAIVSMQQNHATLGGVLERLEVRSIIEDAIHINSAAYDRHGIALVCDFQPVPPILVDRHRVMQILINLLGNAKHALQGKSSDKRVTVSVFSPAPRCVRITVTDNGCGIARENLDRIFSQGFTTRKEGHGFGLHNGALAARELGGCLAVQSNGPGQGAAFTLELPSRPSHIKETKELKGPLP